MRVRGLIVEWVPRPRRHPHRQRQRRQHEDNLRVSGNKRADDIEVRSTARFLEL